MDISASDFYDENEKTEVDNPPEDAAEVGDPEWEENVVSNLEGGRDGHAWEGSYLSTPSSQCRYY